MKTKYAIKVMLAVDDWVYVTKDSKGNPYNLQPLLFDSRQIAEDWANETGWKLYKVVRYRKGIKNA